MAAAPGDYKSLGKPKFLYIRVGLERYNEEQKTKMKTTILQLVLHPVSILTTMILHNAGMLNAITSVKARAEITNQHWSTRVPLLGIVSSYILEYYLLTVNLVLKNILFIRKGL